jgi:MOSC domain-containing protein YiiM
MHVGILLTVQVGTPRHYGAAEPAGARGRPWATSFVRTPSPVPRWLFTTHLEGNLQADTKNHGRPDQAVLVYAAAHYPLWQAELERPEIGPGGFAENFTVDGPTEAMTCIGDVYAIGEARIQVTGPRYPCRKIERRWGITGLTKRVAATGRTGWYCRVVREGMIEPGMPLTLTDRPCPEWTVSITNDFGHGRNRDVERARALAACSLLNPWWQQLVLERALGQ